MSQEISDSNKVVGSSHVASGATNRANKAVTEAKKFFHGHTGRKIGFAIGGALIGEALGINVVQDAKIASKVYGMYEKSKDKEVMNSAGNTTETPVNSTLVGMGGVPLNTEVPVTGGFHNAVQARPNVQPMFQQIPHRPIPEASHPVQWQHSPIPNGGIVMDLNSTNH